MKLKLKGYYSRVTVSGIGVFEADTVYEFDEETAKKLLETGAWEVVETMTVPSVQTSITASESVWTSMTTSKESVVVTTEGGEEE